MNLGPAEILVIAVVALLVVGPSKLPEMARKLGQGMQELRKLQNLSQRQIDDLMRAEPADRAPRTPSENRAVGPAEDDGSRQ